MRQRPGGRAGLVGAASTWRRRGGRRCARGELVADGGGCGGGATLARRWRGGGRVAAGFGCGRGGRRALAFGKDREHRADRRRLAFLDPDLAHDAALVGFELHVGLVGLDLGKHLARRDPVARVLVPAQDGALLHRVAELRHGDLDRHVRTSDAVSIIDRRAASEAPTARGGGLTVAASRCHSTHAMDTARMPP